MTRYLLMGGLGNQLFQLAGALNYAELNSKIELVDKAGNPRTDKSGRAEISSFKLPEHVDLKEKGNTCCIIRKESTTQVDRLDQR